MHSLYPDIQPYTTHLIDMELISGHKRHQIHVEECGNPQGIPVVFLHGGPGSGCRPMHRCYFDPDYYRIILFDQRGCGQSLPHGELEDNTSTQLISDMEVIRRQLNIEKWLIFGGSWGSTLGLLYAQQFPQHVSAMILRGIFLGRQQDIDWAYGDSGAAKIFPEAWDQFIQYLPKSQQQSPLDSYYQHLTGDDELQRMSAAKALQAWESTIVTLRQEEIATDPYRDPGPLAHARIQLHYALNHCFISTNKILDSIDIIRDIPTIIIHARYDMVCPMHQAWELHKAWPEATFQIVPAAGHAAGEPAVINALVLATKDMAELLQ